MEAENLFFQCCERIDEDLEVAETYLVGCIAYIIRERGEVTDRRSRGVRSYIEDDLSVSNYEPYTRELRLISTMHDDSLHSLIASSLDLSKIQKQLISMVKYVDMADDKYMKPSTHASKAKCIAEIAEKIAGKLKPTKRVRTDSSLSSGGE